MSQSPPRILVVDDNATNLALLSEVFEFEGYVVQQAPDAETAQQMVAASPPALILMDVGLPGMDGLTLTRLLKADPATRSIKIVVVTAAAMKGDDARAFAAGCDAYVTKPIDTRAVLAQVATLLGQRQRPASALAAHDAAPAEPAPAPASVAQPDAGPRYSVLVVDDLAANRLLLREMLNAHGHHVLEASDGVEALAVLNGVEMDAVISDALMPNMDGFRLCLELRKSDRFNRLPFVIYTSTYNSSGDETLADQVGADAYLVKPAPPQVLLRVLTEAIGRARARPHRITPAVGDEFTVIKSYNATLVAKLEERNQDLSIAMEAAREASEFSRQIVSDIRKGIAVLDRDLRCQVFNPHLEEITGASAKNVLGRTISEVLSPTQAVETGGHLRRALAGEIVEADVFLERDGRGPGIWISSRISPLRNTRNEVVGVVAAITDITDRKQAESALRESEERYRRLIEDARDIFVTIGSDDTITSLNPAFETITGYARKDWIGKKFWPLIEPEDLSYALHLFQQVLRGGRPEPFVVRLRRWDGEIAAVEFSATLQTTRGSTGLLGIGRDVTERKKLEEQFRQAQKLEAIGTLAGGIAHDFNNILTSINGYTELARMLAEENPTLRDHLDSVLQAGARATDLVRQILAFSRHEEGRRQPVQLRHVVAEALKLLRASIPSTIAFNYVARHDVPAVLADATQIHQVVMNLATNAWHAMRDKPGRLEIILERFEVDEVVVAQHPQLRCGAYARLSISDSGHGMDAATLGRIFEPFFTTKPPGEGTGLGLSVVHGIMKSHDGVTTVYSQPGEGTTFRLYFPAYAAEAPGEHAESIDIPRGNGERILLVDDEEVISRLEKSILEKLGYGVEAKTNAIEALAWFCANPDHFELVITDLTMPGMTGTEFARRLLEVRPELPIILTTGYTINLTEEKVRAMGIRELLLKPPTVQALGAAVHRVLQAPPPDKS